MMELVDMLRLERSAVRRGGSSPPFGKSQATQYVTNKSNNYLAFLLRIYIVVPMLCCDVNNPR